MKRIIFALTVGTMVATLLATAAAPALADDDFRVLEDDFGIVDDVFGVDFNDDEEDDEDEGDVVDDVEVSDPFLVGDDVCVDVVVTFEDGSTETDQQCEELEDLLF